MVDLEIAYEILTSFPLVKEEAAAKPRYYFKSKIFATLNIEKKWITVWLNSEQQSIFCENTAIYPVPNRWGVFGWTHVNLLAISKKDLIEVLCQAYENAVLKGVGKRIRN
jgi:hypothetical protein